MSEMSLLNHLEVLKKRIIYAAIGTLICIIIAYVNYEMITTFFSFPFNKMLPGDASLNVQTIYEGFLIKLKLSCIVGIILGLPFTIFQLCWFLFPGLTGNERFWVILIIVSSSCLSIVSTYFSYTIIFPYIIKFLTTSEFIPQNINILLNYKQNMNYIVSFLFAGIVIFQTPIILEFLLAKNIITRQFLLKNSRWFMIGIIILSAMITPPDIISQLSLALPLIIFYFGCILIAKIMGWGK